MSASIFKIENLQGKIVEKFACNNQEKSVFSKVSELKNKELGISKIANCNGEQVVDPRVAYLITDILRDNNARSPTFGSNSLMVIPNHPEVAVKTGTATISATI